MVLFNISGDDVTYMTSHLMTSQPPFVSDIKKGRKKVNIVLKGRYFNNDG